MIDMLDAIGVPEDDQEYIEWLRRPDGGTYVTVVETGDGRWVGILPLMFHWTMHVGRLSDRSGHDDKFCYRTFDMAADALTEWALREFKGEPDRWHKRPYTGQIRPDGDATREYVDR